MQQDSSSADQFFRQRELSQIVMDPVYFLPEGKHCYDVVESDLAEFDSSSESFESFVNAGNLGLGELFLKAAELGKVEFINNTLNENKDILLTRDSDGYTALHRAAYNGEIEVLKLLISNGGDVSAKTDDGWQPLHCACRWNQIVAAVVLLENGADINAQTNGGQTALHLCSITEDSAKLLEMLLLNDNIDVKIENNLGETAHDIALRNGPHHKLFELQEESINLARSKSSS